MEIRIFDVAHGFCAYLVADNGNVILIDCGHNEYTGFRPSRYLTEHGCSGIERLIVSNYDEDHISDLPGLRSRLPITILHRNPSITAEELKRLKQRGGQIQPGMEALLDMIGTYTSAVTNPPDFANIELVTFYNNYPIFQDTNNLSLIAFVHYGDLHIVFPGDLEVAGWRALLQRDDFCRQLGRVNIFVASHHGRQSGYCPEVFDVCNPEIIIISDESIEYDTQRTNYSQHARGVRFPSGLRYTLTTRDNGMITMTQNQSSGAVINAERGV